MSPANPDSNPSGQVERIREILVGRQLESLEYRLERLESKVPPLPAPEGNALEISLQEMERRHRQEMDELRETFARESFRQSAELQRLSAQLQTLSRTRTDGGEALPDLEQRLEQKFESWKHALSGRLSQREEWLVQEVREELARVRAWAAGNFIPQGVRPASLERLEAAARKFADALSQPAVKP